MRRLCLWTTALLLTFSAPTEERAQQPTPTPSTDATIHILAAAEGVDVGAYGKTVWTRDNNGKWSFANVGLPQGTTITDWTSINSGGTIAAIGNGGHALLLLPVTLTNLADPAKQHNDVDMQIEFKQSDTDTNICCVAWIAAHDPNNSNAPRMPQLVAKAGSISGAAYNWKLQLVLHDRFANNQRDFDTGSIQNTSVAQDTVTIPGNGWKMITDGTPWNIYQDSDWKAAVNQGFFGGDAILSLKINDAAGNALMPQQDYKFRIAGENPDPAKAKSYISSVAGGQFWYAYAIAKHETKNEGGRIYYNHFLEQGGQHQRVPGKEGILNWNNDTTFKKDKNGKTITDPNGNPVIAYDAKGSGGYGLFQLTYASDDPNFIEPRKWLWNWQSNTKQFIVELQGKLSLAQSLCSGLTATYPASGDIPSELHFSAVEAATITYYNGMAGPAIRYVHINGRKKLQPTCWYPTARGWQFLPNTNDYCITVDQSLD